MPFCKICGEYHLENEMATEDTCIYYNNALIHNNQEENDVEDT
jgi:hypothetical protein